MRTEALVYAAVSATVVGALLLVRRRFAAVFSAGGAMGAVAGACVGVNVALERWSLGAGVRTGRATDTVQAASDLGLSGRLRIAFLTGASLRPPVGSAVYVEAVAFVAAAAGAVWLARRGDRERAVGVFAIAVALVAVRLAGGLSYVPGLLAATPLAIAGLVLWRRIRGAAPLVAIAVLGFVAAVATQFPEVEPNGYQWGGRYVLVSGALLTVVGVTALEGLGRRVVATGVAVSMAVSGFGVAFLVQRTHHIGAWAEAVAERPEAVVISRVPYAFRDAGSAYTLDAHWLLGRTRRRCRGRSTWRRGVAPRPLP
jgi:hypothetical protein